MEAEILVHLFVTRTCITLGISNFSFVWLNCVDQKKRSPSLGKTGLPNLRQKIAARKNGKQMHKYCMWCIFLGVANSVGYCGVLIQVTFKVFGPWSFACMSPHMVTPFASIKDVLFV
jgi:hypothetical protein